MNHRICRTLISLSFNNSTRLSKPPLLYSISLLFLSSSSSCPPPPSKRTETKTKVSLQDYLINHLQFSPEAASKAASTKTYLRRPENSNSVLSLLKQSGFTDTHIQNLVRRFPGLICCDADSIIKRKIKILQDFGFSSTEIVDMVSADPWILKRGADILEQSLSALKNIVGSNAFVSKLVKVSSWFLKCDLEKIMMPNIEFLISCGVSTKQIFQHMYSFPRLFLLKPETMMDLVRRVDELGVDRNTKAFLSAVRTLSSMSKENWELKLKFLRSLGLSEDDILSVFRRMPQTLSVSERKIKEVVLLLRAKENIDISFIVKNPSVLLSSVESSLKPRLEIFHVLKSKDLLRRKISLATICKCSKMKFIQKFVDPYTAELGEVSFR